MKQEAIHPWRWRMLTIWIIAFTVVAIWLILANRHRVSDIQKSRVSSCKDNYLSYHKVFGPFFPKHPTGIQKKRQQEFNRIIAQLVAGCGKQTKP